MVWKVIEVFSPHEGAAPIPEAFLEKVKRHAAEMVGHREMTIRFSCGVDLRGDLTNPETGMASDLDALVCPQCGAPWMAMRRG